MILNYFSLLFYHKLYIPFLGIPKLDLGSPKSDTMKQKLSDLKQGATGTIIILDGGAAFQSNLRTRGVREDKRFTVVSSQPFSGPVMISIDGRETAIGRRMATKIIVEVSV